MDDSVIRKNLVELLKGGHGHVGARGALKNVAAQLRTAPPGPGLHSVWEELEHIRLAQEDILRYTLDPGWRSPDFPSGYWPAATESVTDEQWSASVSRFLADLDEVRQLAADPDRDLTALIPTARDAPTCARSSWSPITTPTISDRSCKSARPWRTGRAEDQRGVALEIAFRRAE